MVKLNIFEACKIGDLDTIIDNDSVTPELVDSKGAGCLHYAARGGSIAVLRYLIETAGFSPLARSNTGATALHDAAAKGNLAIVKYLIEECSVSVDDQDGGGITALHLAALYCHPLIVEWLLDEACADESIRTGSSAIPLFFAVTGGDVNCIKILLDENPRLVNMQLMNGATPLYIACQNGQLDIAKMLHGRGGATKIKAYDGMSCLHAAAQLGHVGLVKWLIQEGESIPNDRDFDGATPLHYAASRGHAEVVTWMLKHGGVKVTLDNLGGSALHSAAEMGELAAVQALLESGCDRTIVDNDGLTAAELADKVEQEEAAGLIRGEVTADRLFEESQPDLHIHSPRLSFPPPPPFPPEEEYQTSQGLDPHITETDTACRGTSPLPPPPPLLVSQSVQQYHQYQAHIAPPPSSTQCPPPPPEFQDFPPPPTPPQTEYAIPDVSPITQASEPEPFCATNPTLFGRTFSRVSVDSSSSGVGPFEIQTVVADVHKPIPEWIETPGASRQSSISNSNNNNITQYKTFHNRDTLVSNSNSSSYYSTANFTSKTNTYAHLNGSTNTNKPSSNGYQSISSRQQEHSSFPPPPPLQTCRGESTQSEEEETSLSASTSYSNLPSHDLDDLELPPPPSPLLSQFRHQLSSTYHSTYSDLPPPPPGGPPTFPKHVYQQSQVDTHSSKAPPAHVDVEKKANFARAKALFGNSVASKPEEKPINPGRRKKSFEVGPIKRHDIINPDNGETEASLNNTSTENNSSFSSGRLAKLLMMDYSKSSGDNDNAPTDTSPSSSNSLLGSPTPSTQLQHDSVKSSVDAHRGHVTLISTSANGSKSHSPDKSETRMNNVAVSTLSTNHNADQHKSAAATNSDKIGINTSSSSPVSIAAAAAAAASNGVALRSTGRVGPRNVVSAGPELLNTQSAVNGQNHSSASSSQPTSPVVPKNKHDLIADIQSAVSGASNLSLRRAKSRGEGVSMVYSSKRHSAGPVQAKVTEDTSKPLTGQFDPKNFLDQVEEVDSSGRAVPQWRRHVLAKHAAEKAQKEWEEKSKVDDYEARFKDMPAWKRALIERKEAQEKEFELAGKK